MKFTNNSLLLVIIFFSSFTLCFSQDTIKNYGKNINTNVLREGTHRYLVYFKMNKDSVRNDTLVSYSLTPSLPEEKGLQKRYRKWYGDYFAYSKSEIQTFSFNQSAILQPLIQYAGALKNIPEKIVNYMTPNSGTMYGYAGGGMIMQNRKAFLEIKDSLTNDQVILLMYSMNPASRLTAIEYYWKHKDSFGIGCFALYMPKTLVYLGRISYGMYVSHITMYWIIFSIFKNELAAFSETIGLYEWKNEVGIVAAFMATVTSASLSYNFLEKPFLRLKQRFTFIPSRD